MSLGSKIESLPADLRAIADDMLLEKFGAEEKILDPRDAWVNPYAGISTSTTGTQGTLTLEKLTAAVEAMQKSSIIDKDAVRKRYSEILNEEYKLAINPMYMVSGDWNIGIDMAISEPSEMIIKYE